MNKLHKALLGLALVVGAVALVAGVLLPEAKLVKGEPGNPGSPGKDGKTPTVAELRSLILPLIPKPIPGLKGEPGESLGAISSPDLGPWLRVGGNLVRGNSNSFVQATSTICGYVGPAATSTLLSATAQMTVATDTDLFVEVFKLAKNGYATSSQAITSATTSGEQIGTTLVWKANADGDRGLTLVASTSQDVVFAPYEQLVVKVSAKNNNDANASKMSLTGACKPLWKEL